MQCLEGFWEQTWIKLLNLNLKLERLNISFLKIHMYIRILVTRVKSMSRRFLYVITKSFVCETIYGSIYYSFQSPSDVSDLILYVQNWCEGGLRKNPNRIFNLWIHKWNLLYDRFQCPAGISRSLLRVSHQCAGGCLKTYTSKHFSQIKKFNFNLLRLQTINEWFSEANIDFP